MLKILISTFTLTALLLTAAHSSAEEPRRHRFAVPPFTTVNLPAGEAESAMKVMMSGLESGGKILILRSDETCGTKKCALRIAALSKSHRALLGTVRRSERTLKKAGVLSKKRIISTDAFRLSVKILNAATGKTEYTANENAISLKDLDRAAALTARRISARYAKIPVPAEPVAVVDKTSADVRVDSFFTRIDAGIFASGAAYGGGFEDFAKYGAGAALELSGTTRAVERLVLQTSLTLLDQKDLANSVDRAHLGALTIGGGWKFSIGRSVSFIPGMSAGYACHAVRGVTADDPDAPPAYRYYFDPLASAALSARVLVTPMISMGITLSYSMIFEKENTGMMPSASVGVLYKIQ